MDSSAKQTRILTVNGTVQGVGFRVFVKIKAKRLGLVGAVRNLMDGRVEIVATGDPVSLDILEKHCRKGPPFSVVDELSSDILEDVKAFPDFRVLP